MTEEEKEVLKFFENKEYSFTCEVPKKELYEALGIEETDFETEVIKINTLLNLIQKQQKEIEELKKDKKALVDNYSKVLSSFISKEKIKAKIKKEEKYQETTKKLFTDSLNYHMQEYAIKVLQELLEE